MEFKTLLFALVYVPQGRANPHSICLTTPWLLAWKMVISVFNICLIDFNRVQILHLNFSHVL